MKKAIETTIDVEPINITPMSAEEARVAVEEIKGNLESLRRKLLELERREGWKALGYASWRECAVAEFGHSVGYVYKLLTAAQVEENLAFSPIGETNDSPIGEIPVSQLVELGKLPPEQQLNGFRRAEELAASEGKRRTAAHVRASVQSVLNQQQQALGLKRWNGSSVLPDRDRTEAPGAVDDRPGAYSPTYSLPQPPAWAVAPKPHLPPDAPTIITLFSCGGGVAAGALMAGFSPVAGVEFDPSDPTLSAVFADTYELNFGKHLLRKTVQQAAADGDFARLPRPHILQASPSCQNFSANKADRGETQEDLASAIGIARAIEALKPYAFVLENVRAYRQSECWLNIRETLNKCGYQVVEEIVNMADWGLPQSRVRFIAVAILGQTPPALIPPSLTRRMGWQDAIADILPSLPWRELEPWQLELLPRFAQEMGLVDFTNTSHNATYRTPNKPAFTLRVSHFRRPVTFPWIVAPGATVGQQITASAAARLQGYPAWYQLPSNPGHAGCLVGNAVPPLFVKQLLEKLKPIVEKLAETTPAAVDAASSALDQHDWEETHIPECLADCTSLEEASAFVEQASIQQIWQEVRCLSSAASDPLQQAIALYKSLSPNEQQQFCTATGLRREAALVAN